jgi:hypothetical protein
VFKALQLDEGMCTTNVGIANKTTHKTTFIELVGWTCTHLVAEGSKLIDFTVLEDKFLLLSQLDITLSYHTTLACTTHGYIGIIIKFDGCIIDGDADFPKTNVIAVFHS